MVYSQQSRRRGEVDTRSEALRVINEESPRTNARSAIFQNINPVLQARVPRNYSQALPHIRSIGRATHNARSMPQAMNLHMPHAYRATNNATVPSKIHTDNKVKQLGNAPMDIAFEEDARWRGIHPFNVKGKDLAIFEAELPKGYRYDRSSQDEVAAIPAPGCSPSSLGQFYVLRERGSSAIPIVKPTALRGMGRATSKLKEYVIIKHGLEDLKTSSPATPAENFAQSILSPSKISLPVSPGILDIASGVITQQSGILNFNDTLSISSESVRSVKSAEYASASSNFYNDDGK